MIGSRRSSVPLPGLDTRIAVGPAPSQIEAWHKTGRFSEPGLRFVWKMIVTPPTRSSEPRPISRSTRAANSRVWTTVLRCFKLSRRRRIASFRVASSVRASATMRRDREGGDALGSPAGVATDARREWPAGAAAAAGPIRCFLAVLSHRSLACVRTLAIESHPHRRLGEFPRARCNSRLPFRPRGPRLLLQVPRAVRHERPVAGRRQRAHWRALARFLARTQFGVGDDASKVLSPNATPESRALSSEVVELCENDSYHNNHHPKAVESGAS